MTVVIQGVFMRNGAATEGASRMDGAAAVEVAIPRSGVVAAVGASRICVVDSWP